MTTITIGSTKVGTGAPCFVVAEIGINHNGSVDIAKKLIDLAAAHDCQAVKFQKRTVKAVYSEDELNKPRTFDRCFIEHARERSARGFNILPEESYTRLMENPDATTNGDLKYVLEFNESEYLELADYCDAKGLLWSASPWDTESVDFLEKFDIPFYKVASASLTDEQLLLAIRNTGKPVMLSTGMSTMEQVQRAVALLEGSPLALLHCVSTYPAKDEDLNLRVLHTLRDKFPSLPIGYSGHENGATLAVAAVALGACIVERHITLDRAMPGSDHAASLEPFRLDLMVTNIRRLERALGDGVKRVIPAEVPVMQKLRRVTDF